MSDRMIIALDAWNDDLPVWVETLVHECDATSQGKVAKRLGITASTVSQAIRNSYKGNLSNVEARVLAVFQDAKVTCPAQGEISGETCLKWRDRAKRLTSAAPDRVLMFRACQRCPRHQPTEETPNAG